MTDSVHVALIAATPPTIMAVISAWIGWMNRTKITNVAHAMNSLLDKRVDEARELGNAQGHAQGMKDQKEEK